jgi:outer membrane PBP1 activator LpoA protein
MGEASKSCLGTHPGYHSSLVTQRRHAMPFSASFEALFRGFVLTCALGLAGCATTGPAPVTDRGANSRTAEAEQLVRDGELDAAAQMYLDMSARSGGDSGSSYRLRAAEIMRENGDFNGVAQTIPDIRRKRLYGDEPLRLDLLDAELALRNNDARRAAALLAAPGGSIPDRLMLRVLELRARAESANGDHFAAARIRADLDTRLDGVDRETNRAEIASLLDKIDDANLKNRALALRGDDVLLPWIEQVLRKKGQTLPREMPNLQRPVGTFMADGDNAMRREGFNAVRQIALILPLGGQVASVSQSIRDGFFAAYFADDSASRPQIRTYDAGKSPQEAIAAYQKAVADGAGFVVGPLLREAVGELFRQNLPVRVLALNHPDTGEVPPKGSAEFGLLPDAEGAQAAERMIGLGITRAAVIATEADWAGRASRAFRAQFEARGGQIVGEARVRENEFNYKSAILQAAGSLADVSTSDGVGKLPPEGAGAFISMRPQQARLLMPQMKLAGINVPVFATSHVNSGEVSPSLDRDLDGIEFCDATWLFAPVPGRPDRNEMAHYLSSAGGLGGRLFAFGMDAYALLPYMDWLLANPDTYLDGASGQLAVDSFGRIQRILTWARFSSGVARPVLGALNPLPVQ